MSDYDRGFQNGYERGANVETRNIRDAMERMKDDLAWALKMIEAPHVDRATIERIAYLRRQYGVNND